MKYFAYLRASRRVLDKEVIHIAKDRVVDFYQNVIWLYRPWTDIIECEVGDGCSYELTIIYSDNRKRKMHGDLGEGTVDKTVTVFLCTIPAVLKEKRRKVNVIDGVLQEDVLFSSPSYAAMFVIGKSANGLTSWKGDDGHSLKEIENSETTEENRK